jgi:hypothetical protein
MGAVVAGFNRLIDKFDRVDKLAKRFGASAESIQRLGFAAEQNGASMEQMAKAMAQGNRAAIEASNGLKTYQRAFDALNISVNEFRTLDQESQMRVIADAIANAKDENLALASAQQILGRSALDLMPLLKQGSAEIDRLTDGMTFLNDKQAAAFADANDKMNKIKTQMSGTFGVWITGFVSLFNALVASATQAVIEVWDAVSSVGKAVKQSSKLQFAAASRTLDAMVKRNETAADRIGQAWKEAREEANRTTERDGPPAAIASQDDPMRKKVEAEQVKLNAKIESAKERLAKLTFDALSDEAKLNKLLEERSRILEEFSLVDQPGSKEELRNIEIEARITEIDKETDSLNQKTGRRRKRTYRPEKQKLKKRFPTL